MEKAQGELTDLKIAVISPACADSMAMDISYLYNLNAGPHTHIHITSLKKWGN